jgi:hypothetical protein
VVYLIVSVNEAALLMCQDCCWPVLTLSAKGHYLILCASTSAGILSAHCGKSSLTAMPAYSLVFLMIIVRGLSYTGHCLFGCITNTFSGLPMPNSLYDGSCFTLCTSNFQSHSASMFPILYNGNSEGGHFTLVTVEEAVLHHVPDGLRNGLCARLLYSVPACFLPDHKFSM